MEIPNEKKPYGNKTDLRTADDQLSQGINGKKVQKDNEVKSVVDNNNFAISDEHTKQQSPKVDRVALAKEKMNESKKTWMSTSIDFKMSGLPNKYIACATKRKGIKHINEGTNCQDNFDIKPNEKKEFVIIAIGDGHGDTSHDLSEHGSRIACEQLCKFVNEILLNEDKKNHDIDYFLSAEFKTRLVNKWKESILEFHKKEYDEDGLAEKDNEKILLRYGTTLLFAFAYKGFYIVGQLGDGGIIILNNENVKCRIHKPIPNKKMGGGTSSLCMEYADAFIDIKIYPEGECGGIVLMTDGYFDPWLTNESLFEASRFFLNALLSNISNESNIALAYNGKYNEAVDYVADDISIGILTSNITHKSNVKNIQYTVSNTHSSCTRTAYTLSTEGHSFKGIFSKNFQSRKLNIIGYNSPHENVIFPHKHLLVNGLQFYLYDFLSDKRFTLDDYCENFIINKKYGMDEIMSIKVLINILKTIVDVEQLFKNKKISFVEFSDIIEFSIDDGNVIIYWTHPETTGLITHNNKNIVQVVAKYMINFLGVGKLFYDEKTEYNYISKDRLYELNLRKYPDSYINFLLDAANSKRDISVNDILKKTISLKQYYVCCSNCGKVSLCDNKNYTCTCGKIFELFAFLRKSSDDNTIIPLYTNTIVSVSNSSTAKYERVIEILKKNENKIGYKNISDKTWGAKTTNNEVKFIKPNEIKDVADCISLKINDDEYLIHNESGGK